MLLHAESPVGLSDRAFRAMPWLRARDLGSELAAPGTALA
jgi:hypothetical protein